MDGPDKGEDEQPTQTQMDFCDTMSSQRRGPTDNKATGLDNAGALVLFLVIHSGKQRLLERPCQAV